MPPELPPCPARPNCVSSLAADPARRVEPLGLPARPDVAVRGMAQVVERLGGRVTDSGEDWLTAEFRTFLGFVDDVAMLFHGPTRAIHIRSASRMGWWDLGVNRRRVERIRREWARRRDGEED